VFLARPEQVVQEGHIQFQNFDEFNNAAVGDVQFTIEVERARIGIRAIFGDFFGS